MKKLFLSLSLALTIVALAACRQDSVPLLVRDERVQKTIRTIDQFPAFPTNYTYTDYRQHALDLDTLLFSFAANDVAVPPSYDPSDQSTWTPLGFWIDQSRQPDDYDPLVTGYLKRSFGLPTYVADNRVVSSGSEAVTVIPSVLGSSWVGIDKRAQSIGGDTFDFVDMTLRYYDTGSQLVHNGSVQGQSFWYDIFPQIMFSRLYHLYPDTPYMEEMVLNGAEQWLEALPYFVVDGTANYEFVGFNVVLESPTVVGDHIEPPNGGLAYLFYSAYLISGDDRFLEGAKEVLDYLMTYPKNPNYEAMTDYAPYVAAILNTRHGTEYDIDRLLYYLFEGDSAFRPGWAVMTGDFNGRPVDGLVGQRGDYAFAMNSFHLATTLAPMVKYDTRYADAIGKYLLHLTSNARWFLPHSFDIEHQTMPNYPEFDPNGLLVYEGFRQEFNGIRPIAMGDATTMFGQNSDLSIYSSVFVGGLGAIVSETDQYGILQFDLDATDSLRTNEYRHFLYYNPFDEDHTIHVTPEGGPYDVVNLIEKQLIGRNVDGELRLVVPANSSLLIGLYPPESAFATSDGALLLQGEILTRYDAAVTLPNLVARQELTQSSEIAISYQAPRGDEVTDMAIYFDDILAYQGAPLEMYQYDKALLPDTDYTLRIVVTTRDGRTDTTSKRVVCR